MRRQFDGAALEAPLPAALITCADGDVRNVFTAAWTGIVNTRPPMAYVSIRPTRYSYGIIDKTGEFVINLTTSSMMRAVDFCGARSGRDIDKFEKCHLETVQSERVACPILTASPVALECRVRSKAELGSHTMFLADIVGMSADERYIDSKGKINLEQAGLMAYAHGGYYALGRTLGTFGCAVRKKPRKPAGGRGKR